MRINSKRISRSKIKRNRLMIIAIAVMLILGFGLSRINHYLEPRLRAEAKTQVNIAINNLVTKVLANIDYNRDDLVRITSDHDGNVSQVEYDTLKLNQILYASLDTIDDSLQAAQEGKKDPITDRVFFHEGIVYELPLGYLTHISMLSDVGPTLPIRMKILNHVNGEIKTISEPYGMNNTLLKIVLQVRIEAQAITVLNVNDISVVSEIPLVIQLVNGDIPNFAPFTASSMK
ncbi:sporulation protein YunB [Clostridiaceae bacterium DONG20-135]|uniref:Sporulation protein YunB n=1 Tax=Copranaerobaculum intestinale TaxID=2692629 RepID=A0A6N8U4P8_9FIRM|nr:sporulation protein YunB [Copranaerobaculum intestinale]MXQ73178.1 sporulation protein YunB [Copranaerobaculum intestinale]